MTFILLVTMAMKPIFTLTGGLYRCGINSGHYRCRQPATTWSVGLGEKAQLERWREGRCYSLMAGPLEEYLPAVISPD